MRIRKRSSWLASAATLPLLIGGLTLVTASPASAVTCEHPAWADNDKSGSGFGVLSSTPVRTGVEGACDATAYVGSSVRLWYHCYVFNSFGNTWTNVRIDGTNIVGWVADVNLNNGGSIYPC
jgi:hypothetical protein